MFGYHDNFPIYKYLLLIFAFFGLKELDFKILIKATEVKLHIETYWNDNSIHAQFRNLIFIEVKGPKFWEGQVENRAKTGKMLKVQGYLGAIFSVLHQNIRTCLVTYFWHMTSTFSFRNHKKIAKTAFLYNFPTIPPALHFSLPLFLGYILLIDVPLMWSISFQ